MVEVVVFAEGLTEEAFIKRVVAPSLRAVRVFLKPQLLNTSRDSKGGAISFGRLTINARNTLRQQPNAVLSTFVDLYALDTSFPGFEFAKPIKDVHRRVRHLESALHEAIVEIVGCRPDRFLPHIQPYEFEGLLFSDVRALSSTEPGWATPKTLGQLEKVRHSFDSPEHINDGYETKPSKRLQDLLKPSYRKTRHGPLAAERVGLSTIEAECTHFHHWMELLRALAAT